MQLEKNDKNGTDFLNYLKFSIAVVLNLCLLISMQIYAIKFARFEDRGTCHNTQIEQFDSASGLTEPFDHMFGRYLIP